MENKQENLIISALPHIYSTTSNCIISEIILVDEINRSMMTEAVHTTLQNNPFFSNSITWKEGTPCFEMQSASVTIEDYIPEQPCLKNDGYLFAIYVKDKKIVLAYDHSLTDGPGFRRFETILLTEYLNLRYTRVLSLKTKEPSYLYDVDELNKRYAQLKGTSNLALKTKVLYDDSKILGKSLIRIDRQSFLCCCRNYHTTPFILITTIFCVLMRELKKESSVTFNFAVDMRHRLNVKNALYNCISLLTASAETGTTSQPMTEILAQITKIVNDSLEKDAAFDSFSKMIGIVNELYSTDISFERKQRIFELVQGMNRCDFFVSYNGRALENNKMTEFVADVRRWAHSSNVTFTIEVVEHDDHLNLCVVHRLKEDVFLEPLRNIFSNIQIQVVDEVFE